MASLLVLKESDDKEAVGIGNIPVRKSPPQKRNVQLGQYL